MPTPRDPEASADADSTPVATRSLERERELDDAYELADHEFTIDVELEAEFGDSEEGTQGWSDEHTARWSTTPKPLPAWATTARALLEEPPPLPAARAAAASRVDPDAVDNPTRRASLVTCSIVELRSLRDELAHAQREARERRVALDLSELAVRDARAELLARDRQLALYTAEQIGRLRGQAFRNAELETELQAARRALGDLQAALSLLAQAQPSHAAQVELAPEPELPRAVDPVEQPAAVSGTAPAVVVSPAAPPAAAAPSNIGTRKRRHDDLQEIRGIGPRFAERLEASGVTTYSTIAAWDAADIVRVAEVLGVSAKRIRSEAWVRQARRLCTRIK
ncbi:MAG: hypothetical protein RL701_478 [Pseudomonadota bacterium]